MSITIQQLRLLSNFKAGKQEVRFYLQHISLQDNKLVSGIGVYLAIVPIPNEIKGTYLLNGNSVETFLSLNKKLKNDAKVLVKEEGGKIFLITGDQTFEVELVDVNYPSLTRLEQMIQLLKDVTKQVEFRVDYVQETLARLKKAKYNSTRIIFSGGIGEVSLEGATVIVSGIC